MLGIGRPVGVLDLGLLLSGSLQIELLVVHGLGTGIFLDFPTVKHPIVHL